MLVSGILLAAGSGTRMGMNKCELLYKGQRLIDRALAPLVECRRIDEVIVVVRPDSPLAFAQPRCRTVINADYQEGLGASLRVGVRAAQADADVLVVSLADMPELTSALITTLIEGFLSDGKQILVPVYQRQNGHPVIFAGDCRGDLLRLSGDQGARQLIHEHPERVAHYPTQQRAVVYDVDAPPDLELRHLGFADVGVFQKATVALQRAGVYFETNGPVAADGVPTMISYYPFDEDVVVSLCPGGCKVSLECR